MKIIIGSDFVPTNNNEFLFKNNEIIQKLDSKIKKIWFDSDFRIFNLECVLGSEAKLKPIRKNGPNLIASEECIFGIRALKPNLVLLANNHIFDYGVRGLDNTIKLLDDNEIKYTGIIENSYANISPTILEKDGIKIGIYNLCENEFSVATKNRKGANGFLNLKNYDEIRELKKAVNHVIIIFHGGKEFYRYPSPNQQEISHKFIDCGADMIIFQHSHCIGCEEIYKGKKIIYGQGNFIFDGGSDEYWDTELLLELEINKNCIGVKYHPIEKKDNLISYAENEKILDDFFFRSKKIKNYNFIQEEYDKFSINYLYKYLYNLNGMNFFNRVINKLKLRKFFLKKYNLRSLLAIQNIIECEAHRELLINGIEIYISQIEGEKNED